MISLGFTRISCEYCIYFRESASGSIIAGVHVDDFAIAGSSLTAISEFKHELSSVWTISDLGESKFCIGIAISRDHASRVVSLSQTALIDRIIAQYGLSDAHPVSTPMEAGLHLSRTARNALSQEELSDISKVPYRPLIGCLMYLAIGTRPDIAFAVQQLSQFLDCFASCH